MPRLIEDAAFRTEFEVFAYENGYAISAGANGSGDDTTEVIAKISDFIAAPGAKILSDENHLGRRYVVVQQNETTFLIADHGAARLIYVD